MEVSSLCLANIPEAIEIAARGLIAGEFRCTVCGSSGSIQSFPAGCLGPIYIDSVELFEIRE